MSDGVLPWLIGGAAVGLGFLWWRTKQAKEETKPPATCDALEKLGVPRAVCEAGLPIVGDIVQGIVDAADDLVKTSGDVAAWDQENKALNGEVEIANEGFMRSRSTTCNQPHNCFPALDGTVVKFKNGCVPMSNSPDFAKCAPGTHNMWNYPLLQAFKWAPDGDIGTSFKPLRTEPFSGKFIRPDSDNGTYDPYTLGAFEPGTVGPDGVAVPAGHFGWLIKGQWFVCPQGADPQIVRDHRSGEDVVTQSCGTPRDQGLPPMSDGPDSIVDYGSIDWGSIGQPIFSSQVFDCGGDPNFVVDYLADGTKYCRRKRAGEP